MNKFRTWYNSRLQGSPIKKNRPIIALPGLDISPKSPKILSDVSRFSTYEPDKSQAWPETKYGPIAGQTTPTRAYVRGNIEPKRMDAITAHEQMHQMFNTVNDRYGAKAQAGLVEHLVNHAHPIARKAIDNGLRDIGYDPRSPRYNEEVLNYLHTYLTDPVNRQRIQKLIPSKWQQRVVDKHIKNSWQKVLRAAAGVSASDLHLPSFQKSIGDADWKDIADNHDKDYSKTVDHQFHTVNGKVPQIYQNLLEHPDVAPSLHVPEAGFFPKLVHDVSPYKTPGDPQSVTKSNYVMMKPYHQKLLKGVDYIADKPILGWATMANKALYNAGGIGHLAEEVTAAMHKNIPVTIHSFDSPDFKSVADGIYQDHINGEDSGKQPEYRSKPNPLHTQQIAIMDYLSNNVDRHNNNLLVSDKAGQDGYHPILAIDHALNFQYKKTMPAIRGPEGERDLRDSPKEYLNRSALRFANAASPTDKDWSQLASWWKQNGTGIQQEMNKQLAGITDQSTREHIRKNFNQRWSVLNDWAQDGHSFNHQEMSPFNDFFPNKHGLIPMEDTDAEAKHELRTKLPADAYTAAQMLAEEGHKYPGQAKIMNSLTKDLMQQMNPEQFSNFLINHYQHSVLNVKPLAHDILFGGNNVDEAKLQNFIDQLKKMPPEFQANFPFWGSHFDKTLQQVGE